MYVLIREFLFWRNCRHWLHPKLSKSQVCKFNGMHYTSKHKTRRMLSFKFKLKFKCFILTGGISLLTYLISSLHTPAYFAYMLKKCCIVEKIKETHRQVSNISACRRCSNYIFILDLTHDFIGLGKDNCSTRREKFKFDDLVRLTLEILR